MTSHRHPSCTLWAFGVLLVLAVLAAAPSAAFGAHAAPLAGQWHLDEYYASCGDTRARTADSSGHGLDASAYAASAPAGSAMR